MYDNFAFEKRDSQVAGYTFKCESPEYVMCIIHGIGEHAGRYNRMADALAKHGIAVVSMDLRGHGISSGVRGDTAPRTEVLKDIDALIEYAQEKYPGLPLILYGHSMGGNICLDYKLRGSKNHIPCKYIVSAPWLELVRKIPAPLYRCVKTLAKVAPKMAISSACPEEHLGNPDFVKPYSEDPMVHSKITLRCAVDSFDIGKKIAEGRHENNHRADDKPFLLMHGSADKICAVEGARKVAEQMSGNDKAVYIEWPGYYHEIHNGSPAETGDKVIDKIAEFITEK